MRNNQSGDNSMAKVKKREEYGDDSIEMLKGARQGAEKTVGYFRLERYRGL